MKRLVFVAVLCAIAATPAFADLFSGSLSYPTTIVAGPAGGPWQSTPYPTITWLVTPITDYDANPDIDYYNYAYTFIAKESQGGGLSHLILEVSPTFTLDNLWGLTPTLTVAADSPRTYGIGPGNVGIPGDIFGIKIQSFTNDQDNTWSISFNSDRMPVWGDFYAKGGGTNWAYNTGFLIADPTSLAGDGMHIAVPDTLVPVPAAVVLGLLGLGVAGWKLRRFA